MIKILQKVIDLLKAIRDYLSKKKPKINIDESKIK